MAGVTRQSGREYNTRMFQDHNSPQYCVEFQTMYSVVKVNGTGDMKGTRIPNPRC